MLIEIAFPEKDIWERDCAKSLPDFFALCTTSLHIVSCLLVVVVAGDAGNDNNHNNFIYRFANPKGPRTQRIGSQGPNSIHIIVFCALEPYYWGSWTPRVMYLRLSLAVPRVRKKRLLVFCGTHVEQGEVVLHSISRHLIASIRRLRCGKYAGTLLDCHIARISI